MLQHLESLARTVRRSGKDRKWRELANLLGKRGDLGPLGDRPRRGRLIEDLLFGGFDLVVGSVLQILDVFFVEGRRLRETVGRWSRHVAASIRKPR